MTSQLIAVTTSLLLLGVIARPDSTNTIVIRHDVDDSRYLASAAEFPALVDMPGEGHGVLIAPQWIVTVAHVAAGVQEITLNGVPRKVAHVIIHPGFKALSEALIADALESGDPTKIMESLASSRDIALLKLVEPVTDVAPAVLYRGNDELGKVVKLMGKGATGNGMAGLDPQHIHRGLLRRAFNTITAVDSLWLGYVFDSGPAALPLEGASGMGDSGGPLLIEVDGQWQLAGLIAWEFVEDNVAAHRPSVYGQTSFNARLSGYAEWIEAAMCSDTACTSAQREHDPR